MEINANRILKLPTEHKTSESMEVMIMTNLSGSLSNNDISKIIVDVEKLKVEDQLWKEKEEMRNALDQYIYDMIKNHQIKIQGGTWRRKI